MSQKIPKTGLTGRIRTWMKERRGTFTSTRYCDDAGLHGSERDRAVKTFRDFLRRGEIERVPDKRNQRQNFYKYNHAWKKPVEGYLKKKILKAMYISVSFAITDIKRLAATDSRSFIDKTAKKLMKDGYLIVIGRRRCGHGAGAELIYHIKDRDKFRVEVME